MWEASEAAALEASMAAAAAASGAPARGVTLPGGVLFPALLPYRLQLASVVAAVGRLEAAAQHVAAIIAGPSSSAPSATWSCVWRPQKPGDRKSVV